MDNLLNADVAIIRDQIDKACVDFSEANRRFQAAEKEYVDAKFDLQQKTETKVCKNENACRIIIVGQLDRTSHGSDPDERRAKTEEARGVDIQA